MSFLFIEFEKEISSDQHTYSQRSLFETAAKKAGVNFKEAATSVLHQLAAKVFPRRSEIPWEVVLHQTHRSATREEGRSSSPVKTPITLKAAYKKFPISV